MLCVRGKSELSDVDHHCVVLSNVRAEAFLHGEVFFDRYDSLARLLVERYELQGPLLRLDEFSEYQTRYQNGTFSTWDQLIPDLTTLP
jgi:hypothetical protein